MAVSVADQYNLAIEQCEDTACNTASFSVSSLFEGDGRKRLLRYEIEYLKNESHGRRWLSLSTATAHANLSMNMFKEVPGANISDPWEHPDVQEVTLGSILNEEKWSANVIVNSTGLRPRPTQSYGASLVLHWRNDEAQSDKQREGTQSLRVELLVLESRFRTVNKSECKFPECSCARGSEKFPECSRCAFNHHNFGGDTCFACKKSAGLECLGSYKVHARAGFWQVWAPSFFFGQANYSQLRPAIAIPIQLQPAH
jgi:hypothetical protein